MYYRRNARASRSAVQSLIGSVHVYQCVVNKQLKTIVANKSDEKLENKRLETMKGAKTAMLSDAQLIYSGKFDILISW